MKIAVTYDNGQVFQHLVILKSLKFMMLKMEKF